MPYSLLHYGSVSYTDIAFAILSFAAGLFSGLYIIKQRSFDEKTITAKVEKFTTDAKDQNAVIISKARDHVVQKKKQFESEQEEFMIQLNRIEKTLDMKNASHKKREERVTQLQKNLQEENAAVLALQRSIEQQKHEAKNHLLQTTGFSVESVKRELLEWYEKDFKKDADMRIQRGIEWTQDCAVRDGKNALAEAVYRYTAQTIIEDDEGKIKVSRDEIKGRIVGRGAVNIAFFEELFGVDVIFNDEPNIIIVSCFNLVLREIAKRGLERLMREKIINEEVIRKVKLFAEQDVDKTLRTEGEAVLKVLGLTNMPPDFAKLVGRLKFRTSYGQNIMQHCFEVGYFARLIACEIGADQEIAFLAGFFHDIGKAIDQEVGGSHDVLSKEILEKYGFSWEITHAAWTHHNAIPQETIEARIVQAADAISAGRPGARAESVERYLAKIKDLQDTALAFSGVKKAFAINAGRELRVIADADQITDLNIIPLAQDIATKVQEKGGYPGKIKIVTIRVTKATDYAR